LTGLVGCAIYTIESHTPCWTVPQGDGYCSAFNSSFVIPSAAFVTAKREALKTCHSETRIKAECPRGETTMTPTILAINISIPKFRKCRHRQTFYINAAINRKTAYN